MASKNVIGIIKFKKFSAVFSILVLLISFMSVSVIAPSHPVVDGEEVIFGDPGTITPEDGFMHTMEVFWEDLTGVSETEQIGERYAEANTLIIDGDYENAEVALDEAADSHESLQTELETLSETTVGTVAEETINTETSLQQEDGVLHNAVEEVVATEQTIQTLDSQLAAIESELIADVQAGELTEDHEVLDSFNEVEAESAGTQTALVGETEQVVETISTETGVSDFEAEIFFHGVEEDTGISHEGDVTQEEIITLETAMVEITEEVQTLETAGEDTTSAEQVLTQVELNLDIVSSALEAGDDTTAHEHFVEAEHLTEEVSEFLEAPDANRDELEELVETPQEIQKELEDGEHTDHAGDDNYWNELIARYPDQIEEIKAEQQRAQEVNTLFSTTNLDQVVQQLLSEGKSEAEIHEAVVSAFGDMYDHDYVPPGTFFSERPLPVPVVETGEETEVIGIGRIETVINTETGKEELIGWYDGTPLTTDIQAGGGFVLGHEYTDPTTDTTYKFDINTNGDYFYTYENVLGQEYNVKLPDNYDTQTQAVFDKGDETQKVNYESSTGENVVIEYSTLGTEVKSTTGETLLKDTYDPGKYAVAGGEEIKIDAIGYTLENKDNKATVWTVNPELGGNVYYDTTSGVVFNSEVSTHEEKTTYLDGKYVYAHAGDTYSYNPDTNKWTLPDGKTISAQVAPAPIGAEESKEYKTEHGETWKYEDGVWKAYKDDKVVEQYTPGVNNYYHYEPGETHTDPNTGEIWTATTTDKGETVWTSSTGTTWNPATGEHKDSSGTKVETKSDEHYGYYKDYDTGKTDIYEHAGGYYSETPDGSYNYVNPTTGSSTYSSSGTTWTFNSATGAWTSSTGETHTESAGHTDYAGHVGSYDSSYSGTYSGGGDYSSYSGTYSSGGTYGGHTDGGSYSGGGDTGGHSGGGGGGGGGHVIYEFDEEVTGRIINSYKKYRF